jgi:ferrochelatase
MKPGMNKTGVILLNLGGPDNPEAVRPFLYNLFSDRDIIPLGPSFMQKPLARLISTMRAPKTIKAYSLIGGGSPILKITLQQAEALREALKEHGSISVYVGMRYWHPLIGDTVSMAHKEGIRRLIGLSLYPQYSIATTGSAKKIFDESLKHFNMESRFIDSWNNHPSYIEAVTAVIKERLMGKRTDGLYLLFSAHSLPVKFIEEGDPYVKEIEGTVKSVMNLLGQDIAVPHGIGYQSRSGPVEWIGPSTDEMIVDLSQQGFKSIVIVPISFVSDHIETLYEIDILYTELAKRHGVVLERVDSLNAKPLFISALKDLVLSAT